MHSLLRKWFSILRKKTPIFHKFYLEELRYLNDFKKLKTHLFKSVLDHINVEYYHKIIVDLFQSIHLSKFWYALNKCFSESKYNIFVGTSSDRTIYSTFAFHEKSVLSFRFLTGNRFFIIKKF